jgi:hypothetical protein
MLLSERTGVGAMPARPTMRGAIAAAAAWLALAGGSNAASISEDFAKSTPGSTLTIDHGSWDRLLKAHVRVGADGINRIDYGGFKVKGHADLKAYVASLEKVDVGKLDRSEQMAFWVNLYNAKTIDVVLDKYPVKSIKNISLGGGLKALVTGGPWQAKIMKVGGHDLSLDDVEHVILRPIFRDARVHYAVNCASIGCPNLMPEAFTALRLEALLDAGARAYVNHPRGIAVAGGKVKASSIYSWFQADFGGNEASVLAHVRQHADQALKSKLENITRIDDYDYDWNLNDAKS